MVHDLRSVTARDTDNTNLTAIQTITVVVRQTGNIIDLPVNTDPNFNVPTGSNPRAEGLRLDVAVITKNLDPGKSVKTREQPIVTPLGEPTNIVEALGNGITGIIKRDPEFDNQYTHSDGKYTWWYIEWDVNNIKGWTIEADANGEQILFRRPPDLKISDFNVSDDELNPGQDFELKYGMRVPVSPLQQMSIFTTQKISISTVRNWTQKMIYAVTGNFASLPCVNVETKLLHLQ